MVQTPEYIPPMSLSALWCGVCVCVCVCVCVWWHPGESGQGWDVSMQGRAVDLGVVSAVLSGSSLTCFLGAGVSQFRIGPLISVQLPSFPFLFFFVFFFFFFFFFLFRAAPEAYGGSQARGGIGTAATGLHHSSQQRWIPNLLSKVRD